jgi:hypothetical protein
MRCSMSGSSAASGAQQHAPLLDIMIPSPLERLKRIASR